MKMNMGITTYETEEATSKPVIRKRLVAAWTLPISRYMPTTDENASSGPTGAPRSSSTTLPPSTIDTIASLPKATLQG